MVYVPTAAASFTRKRFRDSLSRLTLHSSTHTITRPHETSMPILPRLNRAVFLLAAAAVFCAAATLPYADSNRYLNDVKALASPNMEGRGAGTKGLTRAERLIEKRYKELHLDPAGVKGYAQPFSVITGARLKPDNRCTVRAGNSQSALKIEQDFVPFSFSSSGQADAPLVFAGYGATADEFHYDDYAGIEVKDKIVVVCATNRQDSQKRAAITA